MKREEHHCPRQETLPFANGKLEGGKRAEFEEHLEACKECRDYLEFVQGLSGAMKDLLEPEKEPCPSSLVLSLYSSGELDQKTKAHVSAHILYCDECFKEILLLEKMEETSMEAVKEPSPKKPLYRLIVRFAKGIFETIVATGELFGGQLQPAVAPVRRVRGKLYRDFIRMSQKIGDNLCMEVRLSGSRGAEKVDISIFMHRITSKGIKEGVENIRVELRNEKGESLTSKVTPRSGIVELGQRFEGKFVIGISSETGTVGEMQLELLPLDAEGGSYEC